MNLIPGVDYMTAAQMAALDPWYGWILGVIVYVILATFPIWITALKD